MKSRQKLNQKTQKGLAAWQRLVLKLPDFTTNSTAPSQGNTKSERAGQKPTKESARSRENQTRMYVDGKRYRVGNPKHPHYELYKKYGIDAVLEVMGLVEDKQQDAFPWGSVFFLAAITGLILFTTMRS